MNNLTNRRFFRSVLAAGTAVVALAGATGASAQTSSPSDLRGYNSCVKALDTDQLTGVQFPRVYYIAKNGVSKTYYVNASAWQDGNRVLKRLSCTTSSNGRQVLAFESLDGQFALRNGKQLEVARR